jgi:sugar phosphate permease
VKGWSGGQWKVLAILVIGYSLFYLCRSNLSVTRGLIIDEHAAEGWTKATIGLITSVATAFYALGKFFGGVIADKLGGKTAFLSGMAGAVVFNLLFAMGGGFPLFMLAWSGNRFLQSFGWPGMVKLAGGWFPARVYGGVMAIVSLSYLFGDFASRKLLGFMLDQGMHWRQLFWIPALGLLAFAVLTFFLLKENPEVKEPGEEFKAQFRPKKSPLKSPAFWTACVLSFSFTLMRETFNEWTPTILSEVGGLSSAAAADQSSYFPLAGGLSVLAVGWLSDRWGAARRGVFIVGGLLAGGAILVALSMMMNTLPSLALTFGVALTAFALIGPYSLLAGAISLDLGGEESGATASGWIDGIGYIGGMISGYGIASLAQAWGWSSAFVGLGVLSLVSAIFGVVYLQMAKRELADES